MCQLFPKRCILYQVDTQEKGGQNVGTLEMVQDHSFWLLWFLGSICHTLHGTVHLKTSYPGMKFVTLAYIILRFFHLEVI